MLQRNEANCPSAGRGKPKCFEVQHWCLIHFSVESIPVMLHQLGLASIGINYANPYRHLFVSHNQVMSVFLQCYVSAPNQCSKTGSVFTHILCYINRSRWAVLAAIYCLCHLTIIRGYWFYFLLLHTQKDQTSSPQMFLQTNVHEKRQRQSDDAKATTV